MISKEENDLLTQTGPGTPCGEMMRRYWQPVALSEELPAGGALLRKDLVGRERSDLCPDYKMIRNQANRFLQDREAMKTKTYAGMGAGFQAHDAFATASQGTIQSRRQEHLVSSDKAIVSARKLAEKAIRDLQEGKEPPHVIRSSAENRFPQLVISEMVPAGGDWKEYTKTLETEARATL
jgi:hypothetical protein